MCWSPVISIVIALFGIHLHQSCSNSMLYRFLTGNQDFHGIRSCLTRSHQNYLRFVDMLLQWFLNLTLLSWDAFASNNNGALISLRMVSIHSRLLDSDLQLAAGLITSICNRIVHCLTTQTSHATILTEINESNYHSFN